MDLEIGLTYNFQATMGYGALNSMQFQATVIDRKIAGVHNGQQTYVYRIVVRNQEGIEIWIPQNYLSNNQIRAWL